MMPYEDLLVLAAKDTVVKTHGEAILNWTVHTWRAAVMGALRTYKDIPDAVLRQEYPDA